MGNLREMIAIWVARHCIGRAGAARLRCDEPHFFAHSFARRTARDFDFAGDCGALGRVALSLGYRGSVCEPGGENLFYYFRVSDYYASAQGACEDLDDPAGRILCAAGLPDSARGRSV